MLKRLPLLFRHITYNLRGGFLVRPLIIALTLGCLGAVLSWIEESVSSFGRWLPVVFFPSNADPQVAQVILSDIAGSIMTVVSIVFAILLMTLTLASMQFSPRIIVSFAKDRVTQWTLGVFLGTFSYCMAALPAARSLPHPFAPVGTVAGAMLLALACVCWLLFFIHHISHAISVSYIVDRIASETEEVIREVMPWQRATHPLPDEHALRVEECETPILAHASGYIRFIDVNRLIAIAKSCQVKLVVVRRVGQFVPEGTPLMLVHKGDRISGADKEGLTGAFDLGPSRTMQQDVEFGVLQIVDIALKAISPAVNDPTTAVNCVDQLSRIMILFASRENPPAILYEPPGVARVRVRWIGFDGLLTSAFEQIRLYSKGDVAVSLRMLRALSDIASTTPSVELRKSLFEMAQRIAGGCAERLGAQELMPIQARLAGIEKMMISQP